MSEIDEDDRQSNVSGITIIVDESMCEGKIEMMDDEAMMVTLFDRF